MTKGKKNNTRRTTTTLDTKAWAKITDFFFFKFLKKVKCLFRLGWGGKHPAFFSGLVWMNFLYPLTLSNPFYLPTYL